MEQLDHGGQHAMQQAMQRLMSQPMLIQMMQQITQAQVSQEMLMLSPAWRGDRRSTLRFTRLLRGSSPSQDLSPQTAQALFDCFNIFGQQDDSGLRVEHAELEREAP